jgi:hypothetical protein
MPRFAKKSKARYTQRGGWKMDIVIFYVPEHTKICERKNYLL